MSRVTLFDKTFETSIPEADIKSRVKELAAAISKDMEGRNPLFICVLNGAFVFAADLLREITIPCEVTFVKLASYQGTISSGKVHEVLGINENLSGRTVVIVEDIVESGRTMKKMIEPDKLVEPLEIEYKAFIIPNDFIVGYGLDYDQQGRNLKDIYTLVDD